jgi:hypothetical protein
MSLTPTYIQSLCRNNNNYCGEFDIFLRFILQSFFNLNNPLSFARKEENGAMELQEEKKAHAKCE